MSVSPYGALPLVGSTGRESGLMLIASLVLNPNLGRNPRKKLLLTMCMRTLLDPCSRSSGRSINDVIPTTVREARSRGSMLELRRLTARREKGKPAVGSGIAGSG